MWGATVVPASFSIPPAFQSTLPMWGATINAKPACTLYTYFNPHSPCGERRQTRWKGQTPAYFNPHSPCGERPKRIRESFTAPTFQSTLPMWGATTILTIDATRFHISIHTPHVGSDPVMALSQLSRLCISIHTPHAGSDWRGIFPFWSRPLFQSTLPMRGATLDGVAWTMDRMKFQSTLPMRGATTTQDGSRKNAQISIHTPHAGSDAVPPFWL